MTDQFVGDDPCHSWGEDDGRWAWLRGGSARELLLCALEGAIELFVEGRRLVRIDNELADRVRGTLSPDLSPQLHPASTADVVESLLTQRSHPNLLAERHEPGGPTRGTQRSSESTPPRHEPMNPGSVR
jgi:hypothetical protein